MIDKTTYSRTTALAATLIAVGALAGVACGGGGLPPEVTVVPQADLLRQIDAGEAPLILDVRSPEEYAEGHVPGAVNIEYTELAGRLSEIESARDAPVVVYCQSGRRAGIAETLLLEQGFGDVRHLEGDMGAWREAGLPTEK